MRSEVSEELKRINVNLPIETYKQIKLLGILHSKSMEEIIVDAVKVLSKEPHDKTELKRLKHQVYKLKYDSHEKDAK